MTRALAGLSALTALPGPTGCEDAVAKHILGALASEELVSHVDRLGNVVCWTSAGRPAGLVTAHMDQVGFMVSRVERDQAVCLPVGSPVLDRRAGVVVASGAASGRASVIERRGDLLVVRCGRAEGLATGDRILFSPALEVDEEVVTGVALDDRLGCWLLLALAGALATERPDLAFAWTVREETEVSGAVHVARALEPCWHLAVDTTDAGEHAEEGGSAIRVGDGPAITLMDEGMVADATLLDLVSRVASQRGIPWQAEVVEEGLSEAGQLQATLGIPALAVLVPLAASHSPAELAAIHDVLETLRLLHAALLVMGERFPSATGSAGSGRAPSA